MLLLERFSDQIKIESKVGNKVCLRISDAIFDLLTKSTRSKSASALLPRPLPTSMLLRKRNNGYGVFENWLNGFEKVAAESECPSATCGRYWISRLASDIGTERYQLIAISRPVWRVMSVLCTVLFCVLRINLVKKQWNKRLCNVIEILHRVAPSLWWNRRKPSVPSKSQRLSKKFLLNNSWPAWNSVAI